MILHVPHSPRTVPADVRAGIVLDDAPGKRARPHPTRRPPGSQPRPPSVVPPCPPLRPGSSATGSRDWPAGRGPVTPAGGRLRAPGGSRRRAALRVDGRVGGAARPRPLSGARGGQPCPPRACAHHHRAGPPRAAPRERVRTRARKHRCHGVTGVQGNRPGRPDLRTPIGLVSSDRPWNAAGRAQVPPAPRLPRRSGVAPGRERGACRSARTPADRRCRLRAAPHVSVRTVELRQPLLVRRGQDLPGAGRSGR